MRAGQRHSVKLAVFIQIGHRPIVLKAAQHSSSQKNQAASSSRAAASNTKVDWCGERYCEVVRQALLSGGGAGAAGQRPAKVQLVHDRDSCHTCGRFKSFARDNNIAVVELPAKAADLDPLDYGVFGPVKRAWEKVVWVERLSWKAQVDLLIDLLEQHDCDAAIASLPDRIQKCIDSNGWHFEG